MKEGGQLSEYLFEQTKPNYPVNLDNFVKKIKIQNKPKYSRVNPVSMSKNKVSIRMAHIKNAKRTQFSE